MIPQRTAAAAAAAAAAGAGGDPDLKAYEQPADCAGLGLIVNDQQIGEWDPQAIYIYIP